MTTTVQIDDNLLAKAAQATGISDATILVRDGLAALAEHHHPQPAAKPLGQYLIDNIPRGTEIPIPNRDEPARGFLINEEQG